MVVNKAAMGVSPAASPPPPPTFGAVPVWVCVGAGAGAIPEVVGVVRDAALPGMAGRGTEEREGWRALPMERERVWGLGERKGGELLSSVDCVGPGEESLGRAWERACAALRSLLVAMSACVEARGACMCVCAVQSCPQA